ncbi:MAG: sigma-54-dependent Fis family transcriptional regulator [Pirellulaceae bacterium]
MTQLAANDRIRNCPDAIPLAVELLSLAASTTSVDEFFRLAVKSIREHQRLPIVQMVSNRQGTWTSLANFPEQNRDALPSKLLADVLDSGNAVQDSAWAAAPLFRRTNDSRILLVQASSAKDRLLDWLDAIAAAVAEATNLVTRQQANVARIRRLEAILGIAAQWNQNLETIPLLEQMAETSTRLFSAERASIFLWDRPNHQLVGRPALGIESGELRIPDNAGVVGDVVQHDLVRRVDQEAVHDDVNRQVDQQLGFQTRTLLCVPLKGRNGKMLGAFELINKVGGNFSAADEEGLVELASHAAIALENSQQIQQLVESRKQVVEEVASSVRLIGDSKAMQTLRQAVERVAKTDLSLLVLGENGTGKEVVSRMIHYLSPRRNEPFVAVNCAAIAETLLESELFGHERGAFTDAHEARAGKFELASGGTLFLDEIGDLSLSGQAKLLRVLEEKVVVRVGGSLPIATDARVVAATNQDLAKMVRERRFREDLFFRLNVVTLDMPPLRERVDDIIQLAEHFLDEFCRKARRPVPTLSKEAVSRLRQHHWPGNVRELRNLIERLAYLSAGDSIESSDLAFTNRTSDEPTYSLDLTLADATRDFQVEYIRKQIERTGGNMSEAAENMGLHRSNLYRKMRQLDMPAD